MADEILEAMEREEGKLVERLSRIQAAKAAYLGSTSPTEAPQTALPKSSLVASQKGKVTIIRSARRREVEEIVVNYLEGKGRRAPSGELYEVVTRAGIDIGGATPSKSLASSLSTSDKFNNIKGLGYGLAEWGESPGPKAQKDEAPTESSEGAPQVTGEAGASLNDGREDDLLLD